MPRVHGKSLLSNANKRRVMAGIPIAKQFLVHLTTASRIRFARALPSRVPAIPAISIASWFTTIACGLIIAITSDSSFSQTPAQVQYTYDAAGNVIQITRAAAAPLPDLTITNAVVGTVTVNINGSFNIPVSFQVNNAGNGVATATWADRGYLSANNLLHDTDQVLTGANTRSSNLAAGGNYPVSLTLTTATGTSPGNYFLVLKSDGGIGTGQLSPTGPNAVAESNENNNTQAVAINLPANAQPDLTISNVSVGTLAGNANGSYGIPVTYTVTNAGQAPTAVNFYTLTYLSNDGSLDTADLNLTGSNLRNTPLAAGASFTATTTYSSATTTVPGAYTLFIKADGRGSAINAGTNIDSGTVPESNEANNTQSLALTLPAKVDLVLSNPSVGVVSVSQAGAYSVPVTYTVTNTGGVGAAPNWFDLAYLSTNTTLENSDVNLSGYLLRNTVLAAGASYTVTTTFTSTTGTSPGNYTLFIKTDGRSASYGAGTSTDAGALVEGNEANNVQALTLTLPAKPDLVVSNVSVGSISVSQTGAYNVPVTFTVTNAGGVSAPPSWFDLAYLSTDTALDNADQNFSGYSLRNTALATGASYTVTKTYSTTAATVPGAYTLFVKSDGRGTAIGSGSNTDSGYVAEGTEANNQQALGITLPPKPDLVVSNVSVGTIVKNGNASKSIPVTFTVTNSGGIAAPPNWFDLAYISTDGVLDNADQNLTVYNFRNAALAVGASYTVTVTFVTTTATPAGAFTLFLKTDGRGTTIGSGSNTDQGTLSEGAEANNVVSIAVVLP